MLSAEIREQFLQYFESLGHTRVPSSSLVPEGDPTLLFTNAGMVQFKNVFLGLEKRPYTRATSAQKCMRVSGKHNDLENVGPSTRHHTFFEMLGNFSFGDYFKREAIQYAHTFVTKVLGIANERLVFTVFEDDEEAYHAWLEIPGVRPEQVLRMGEKTNFWMMGDVGPCGPTSEIHYDYGPEFCTCGDPRCSVALDNGCERWLEIWNLVFMQYDQRPDGTRVPLPKPGVDTGMGLERITSVMQSKRSNYETDLFLPLMDRIQRLLGHTEEEKARHLVSYRVVADHGRAATFLIADGVIPGNEGRNYVLRMIIRRAIRFGRKAGFTGPFLGEVADVVIHHMGPYYPELRANRELILRILSQEEERFQETLSVGLARLEEVIEGITARGEVVLPGEEVFRLWDTYGFPKEMTLDIAKERGLTVDWAGFEAAMEAQRARARAVWEAQVERAAHDVYRWVVQRDVRTEFVGYDHLTYRGKVLALIAENRIVERAEEGMEIEVVLDRTPFYAEAGGQVGDRGQILGPNGVVEVRDVQRPLPEFAVHIGRVTSGSIAVGDEVEARVDAEFRWDVMRNHTATHLLHRALREILGEHARQAGSLVAPDRLRFDFIHFAPLTPEEIRRIEERVNEKILESLPVTIAFMPYPEAISLGTMALFGEKYGEIVRVVSIDGYSRELCGGTHLQNTSQVGLLKIVEEGGIGAGIRRITAVTGWGAYRWMLEQEERLRQMAEVLKVMPHEVPERIQKLVQRVRELERELVILQTQAATDVEHLVARAKEIEGIKVVTARFDQLRPEVLRSIGDRIKAAVGTGVVVLGSAVDEKAVLIAMATKDATARGIHAGRLVKEVASLVDGTGGGRAELGQGGGRSFHQLEKALAAVEKAVRRQLKEKTKVRS
ncbi:MAG: alanine--tRNA ligase [Armatimonadota bacterium]|nr:alanine--tRNA ligase [Armatimonadota bacterium]MDR5702930.1 alanine--tRNA ligase [Armatimonadota bacterium]